MIEIDISATVPLQGVAVLTDTKTGKLRMKVSICCRLFSEFG
jgi:hypothetical protein